MKNRRHIFVLGAGLLLAIAAVKPVYASNSTPQIRCLAVDSVGDVTITWVIPADTSSASFLSYNLYTATSKTGPYTNSAVVNTINQSSVTINGLGANGAPVYVYILTNTTSGFSAANDTLETIFLNITNLGGRAQLMWNPIHTPNLTTSTGWYKIYREYPQYVWALADSTQALVYIDTITVCKAFLNYRVEIEDVSGCNSVSNEMGGTFKNIIAPPATPLDTVSVTSGNGVYISWYPSTKNDVVGYYVYETINNIHTIIATVNGINNTSYYLANGNPDSASLQFLIAPFDSCGNRGLQDAAQNTLFLTQSPDSCLHENLLSWNSYANLLPGVKKYNVYVSINGGPYTVMASTGRGTTSFLEMGMTTVATYNYYVQVVDSDNPGITASSNIINYKVTVPPLPKFSYLQTATVNGGGASNNVYCYVDSSAECNTYILQRADAQAGPFNTVATATSTGDYVSFADPTANPNKQSYYYYVITQNQCGFDVDTSQTSQTMFLAAYGDATGFNTLSWNDYTQWKNGVSAYYVYRNEDGGPFSLVATLPYTAAVTNVYKDDIRSIIQGQGIFSYYIIAVETPSSYPFVDTSLSNIAQAYQDPRVYIPNAFDPKGVNSIFIPVGVFEDLQGYDFSIFSRQGELLFETQNTAQGWNGKYGGSLCPEGVYVYHLVYTSSKGEYFDRKGTVTLLR